MDALVVVNSAQEVILVPKDYKDLKCITVNSDGSYSERKVFVIDEDCQIKVEGCQLSHGETFEWLISISSQNQKRVVFRLITSSIVEAVDWIKNNLHWKNISFTFSGSFAEPQKKRRGRKPKKQIDVEQIPELPFLNSNCSNEQISEESN